MICLMFLRIYFGIYASDNQKTEFVFSTLFKRTIFPSIQIHLYAFSDLSWILACQGSKPNLDICSCLVWFEHWVCHALVEVLCCEREESFYHSSLSLVNPVEMNG